MKRFLAALTLLFACHAAFSQAGNRAPVPQPPKVLLLYSLNVEADHVLFATDALRYFAELADKDGFRVEATTNWSELNDDNLKQYKLVVWLNNSAPGPQ